MLFCSAERMFSGEGRVCCAAKGEKGNTSPLFLQIVSLECFSVSPPPCGTWGLTLTKKQKLRYHTLLLTGTRLVTNIIVKFSLELATIERSQPQNANLPQQLAQAHSLIGSSTPASTTTTTPSTNSQEDEWKNIHVVNLC